MLVNTPFALMGWWIAPPGTLLPLLLLSCSSSVTILVQAVLAGGLRSPRTDGPFATALPGFTAFPLQYSDAVFHRDGQNRGGRVPIALGHQHDVGHGETAVVAQILCRQRDGQGTSTTRHGQSLQDVDCDWSSFVFVFRDGREWQNLEGGLH